MVRYLAFVVLAAASVLLVPGTPAHSEEAASAQAPLQAYMARETIAIAGAPDAATLADVAARGYAVVVDLRWPTEGTQVEGALVETLGMQYVNIPVNGAAGFSNEQVTAFAQILAAAKGPVYVHCASGNRAGAMWAAYRMSEGASWDVAMAEGRAAGMSPSWEDRLRPYCKAC